MAETAPRTFEPGKPNAAIVRSNQLREQGLAYEEAHTLRQEAIDTRAISPEVTQLNDAAELAIFGTIRGSKENVVDADGNPIEVKGKLQEIRENPRYGTKEADRKLAAERYEQDMLHLVDQGFELCQAKIITDRFEERVQAAEAQEHAMNHKVTSLINAGKSPAEAKAMVDRLMAKTKIDPRKEDKDFREIVRKDGIFTEDLARTYPEDGEAPTEPMKVPESVAAYPGLLEEWKAARDEFARISAQRGRRSVIFGNENEYNKGALIAARERYEAAQLNLSVQEIRIAREAGLSGAELANTVGAAVAETEWSLASAMYDHRQVATGRAKFNSDGTVSQVKPKTPFGKLARQFEDWLGKANPVISVGGKKIELKGGAAIKKTVAMLGLGVAIGIPTAVTGGLILGPILGGTLGPAAVTGITRSLLMSRASNRLEGKKRIDDLSDEFQRGIIDRSNDPKHSPLDVVIGGTAEEQVSGQVSGNRKRLGKAAVLGAAGAFGGDLIGHAVGLDHVFGHSGHNGHTTVEQGQGKVGNGMPPTIHGHGGGTGNGTPPAITNHHHTGGGNPNIHDVSPKNIHGKYVWNVYANAEGAGPGTKAMIEAAGLAHNQGLLNVVYPNPSNLNDFHYILTEKGANMVHAVAGSTDTEDVMKVLSGFGNVQLR